METSKIVMRSNLQEKPLIFICNNSLPAPGDIVTLEAGKYKIKSMDIQNNFIELENIRGNWDFEYNFNISLKTAMKIINFLPSFIFLLLFTIAMFLFIPQINKTAIIAIFITYLLLDIYKYFIKP